MFNWIRKAFLAIAEADRLKAETQAAREEAAEWRERFLAEIAANRRREDALRKEILRLGAGTQPKLPFRADDWADTVTVAEPQEAPTGYPREVRAVAEQFAANAAEQGRPYSESEYAQLLETIALAPEDYGIG